MEVVKDIDDYDMYDLDFDEFMRRGREAFGIPEPIKEEKDPHI